MSQNTSNSIYVIFLDVDGVLNANSTKELTPNGYVFVEDVFIERLKEIVEYKDNTRVVLSSSWRTDTSGDLELLQERLMRFGIEIFDTTINMLRCARGTEIFEWLETAEQEGYTIEGVVILDDMRNMKPLNAFFVQTSFVEGLQDKHVKKAKERLDKSYEKWKNHPKRQDTLDTVREDIHKFKEAGLLTLDNTRRMAEERGI